MRVEQKQQIFERLEAHREDLERFGVGRVGLFGSFVKERQSVGSDVDLVVEFKEGRKSFDNFMNLASFLEDLLGRKVELLTPESLSRHLGPKILREMEYAITD